MKKLLILMLAGFAFLVTGCQNSVDSEAEKAKKDVTTPDNKGDDTENGGNTESPINIGDDGTVTIGARSLVYIKETTETVDSVNYTVKNYADVYVEDPYFYTYYKLYYLNNKLRRLHVYYHGFECERDYKYTEFVEHICSVEELREEVCAKYSYYENGKIESYYREYYDKDQLIWREGKYDLEGNYIYEKYYELDGGRIHLGETFYFTNGKEKLEIRFEDNILEDLTAHYESGYCRYYYNRQAGYLYFYEDGKVKYGSTNESDFSTKTTCTEAEALELIESIKNS